MTTPSDASIARPAGFRRAAFEAVLETRDEPGWLPGSRREQHGCYSGRLDVPLDPEEFKRVDLRAFRPDDYLVGAPATSPAEFATLLADRAEVVGSVTHVDGATSRRVLDDRLARQGVLFGDLA